jgi:hypothetical protein
MQFYHFTSLQNLVGLFGFAAIGRALDDSDSVDPRDFAQVDAILRAGLKPMMGVSASAMIYEWLEPCVWLTVWPEGPYSNTGGRFAWRITIEIEPGDSRLVSWNDLLRRYKPQFFGNLPAAQDIAGPGGFWVYFGTISPLRFKAVECPAERQWATNSESARMGLNLDEKAQAFASTDPRPFQLQQAG